MGPGTGSVNLGWGVREGQGMEGRPPRGTHTAFAVPPPLSGCRRTHPAPFLCLLTHQECSVLPAGSTGARGLFPAEISLSAGTGSALSPGVVSLAPTCLPCPACAVPAPGPFTLLTPSQPLISAQTLHQGPTCPALCRIKLGLLGSICSSSAPRVTAGTSPPL